MEQDAIKRITTELGCTEIYEKMHFRCSLLECEQTRITVTGGSNVGKTRLINAIAETQMEVSLLPTTQTIKIAIKGLEQNGDVVSESSWMKAENIEIWELSDHNLEADPKPIDLGLHFAHTDICVILLNTMAALNRSEMNQINFLEQTCIPTLLVLSKADLVPYEDYSKVREYVSQKTAKYNFVKLLAISEALPTEGMAIHVKSAINNLLSETDTKANSRTSLSRLYTEDAIVAITEVCKIKLEAVEEKKNKVREMTDRKKSDLSDKTAVWMQLQTELTVRKNKTMTKIHESLSNMAFEETEILIYGKRYCEKDLPSEMFFYARHSAKTAMHIVNKNIQETIEWLNNEIKHSFNIAPNISQLATYFIESDSHITTVNPDFPTLSKARNIAKCCMVATIVATCTIPFTGGLSFFIMIACLITGIGAIAFINVKKNKIKSLVEQSINETHQYLVIDATNKLNELYDELIHTIIDCQCKWKNEIVAQIDNENDIALDNCQVEAENLKKYLQEINSISEKLQIK